MQMLYNSDSYVVVQFDEPESTREARPDAAPQAARRGGYEIVDKFARKEIYLQGELADSFRRGVQALVDAGPNEEELDDYIGGYTALAQQSLVLH